MKDSKDSNYVSSEKDGKLGNSSSKSKKQAKPQGTHAVEVINSEDDYDCDSSPERSVTVLREKVHPLFFFSHRYTFCGK